MTSVVPLTDKQLHQLVNEYHRKILKSFFKNLKNVLKNHKFVMIWNKKILFEF